MGLMPAVILAGGLGTRLREETDFKPKPMVEIGNKPVLWHIMKHLASFGINEFIICAGYKGDVIRDYFLNYFSRQSDFTISLADNSIEHHDTNGELDWKVTVAETGQLTPTGGRVKLIEKYIKSDKFLCTYGDGLANINISELVDFHDKHNGIATITGVKPPSRFGILDIDESHLVSSFLEKPNTQDLINGGYFIFDKGVFNFLKNDSVLEQEPMTELVANGQLHCFQHNGFWQPMDTYREFEMLNKMWNQGTVPWRISK